ncbi:hypothetical protein DSM106972_064710 [Dulcicalothrix desertica PCC 7102]|uniref:Uncharacterized protein n=2 Tax=Dulcicalothrix desertica TaxID=32056 RepID=A0A433V718_9CYAN|nr:hypothetical protein DSM106972_064710 [Dulcicalothrix desertica PCC 7102]
MFNAAEIVELYQQHTEDTGQYTEQKTSTSLTTEDPQLKLEITEDLLRDHLSKWRLFHQDVEFDTSKYKNLVVIASNIKFCLC